MNIGLLGQKDYPTRSGGIEVVIGEIAPRLAARGNKVTVYNRGKNELAPKHMMINGVEVIPCLSVKKGGVGAFIGSFTATISALFHHHDVIHYHAIGPSGMVFIPKLFNIPTVATVHGLDWNRRKWGRFARTYLLWCERNMVRYADEVIVLSENDRDYYAKTYGRETHLITNGISPLPHLFPEIIKEKWGVEEDEYILYLGRITPEKGIEYLIKAFKQIDTDKKLIIAGAMEGDEYCNYIRELAADDDRICFAGFVTGNTLIELYDNCSVYCLPSELEGMSLTLLEALSSGTNVLTSDISENVSVAPQFITSFKNMSIESLKEKLIMLMNRERNIRHRYEQKDFVADIYNWEDVIDRTLEVYRTAIAGHNKQLS